MKRDNSEILTEIRSLLGDLKQQIAALELKIDALSVSDSAFGGFDESIDLWMGDEEVEPSDVEEVSGVVDENDAGEEGDTSEERVAGAESDDDAGEVASEDGDASGEGVAGEDGGASGEGVAGAEGVASEEGIAGEEEEVSVADDEGPVAVEEKVFAGIAVEQIGPDVEDLPDDVSLSSGPMLEDHLAVKDSVQDLPVPESPSPIEETVAVIEPSFEEPVKESLFVDLPAAQAPYADDSATQVAPAEEVVDSEDIPQASDSSQSPVNWVFEDAAVEETAAGQPFRRPEPESSTGLGHVPDLFAESGLVETERPANQKPGEIFMGEVEETAEAGIVDMKEAEEDDDDPFAAFFGGVPEKPAKSRSQSHSKRTLADKMAISEPWKTDIPGAPIRDIRSGIALYDRALMIQTLFDEDPALFQDAIITLNSMTSFDDAVKYVYDRFPSWDMSSETVYKFMMAIRRKIR